jgi:hypothetical protein
VSVNIPGRLWAVNQNGYCLFCWPLFLLCRYGVLMLTVAPGVPRAVPEVVVLLVSACTADHDVAIL